MSFQTQAALAADEALLARMTACAAGIGITDPYSWVFQYRWRLAATDGWDTAVEAAVGEVVTRMDPQAPISDEMILAAVTTILNDERAQEGGE